MIGVNLMIKEYLEVGQIVGTHAIKGEVRINAWCDSPDFLKKFKRLYLDENGNDFVDITSCRVHGNVAIAKIKGIDSINEAITMKNKILFIRRKDASIPKGSYFIAELIDCTVIDAKDETKTYGIISDVSQTGANDVWHIKDNDVEYLIPAIPDVIDEVDVEKGIIRINPLKGIFDDEN